ncbi:MAG TPA: hypothetical protein VH879_04040 [Gemmatimonadales bacterium]
MSRAMHSSTGRRLAPVALLSLVLVLSSACAGWRNESRTQVSQNPRPAPTHRGGGAAANEVRVSGPQALLGPQAVQARRAKRSVKDVPIDGPRVLLNHTKDLSSHAKRVRHAC